MFAAMKTLAQALIEERYVKHGETTRVIVLPLPDTGLPQELVDAGEPVPIDLLANRPLHLELDEQGFSADLCFAGPPVRCRFRWDMVTAVQDASGDLVATVVLVPMMRLANGDLVTLSGQAGQSATEESPSEHGESPRPVEASRPTPPHGRRKGHLRLVTSDD